MIEFTDTDEIEAAFTYYRKYGFPYHIMQQHEIIHSFRKLQAATAKINKQKSNLLGTKITTIEVQPIGDVFLANYFHPHIWESKAVGMRSPIESFHIDKSLKKALKLTLESKGHIPNKGPKELLLQIVNGTQMCSNFRPTAAKAVYDFFKPKNVLDMSTGYGGRLLGFLASKSKGIYFGVDPSIRTCNCNRNIAKTLNATKRVKIKCLPFEDVGRLPLVDLAFTSTPYFSKEIYDSAPNQSRERYASYDEWINCFLSVLLQKSNKTLKKNGTLALNIANVKIKNKIYPLIEDTIQIAKTHNIELAYRLHIIFPGFGKGLAKQKTEPILIFNK